MTPRTERHDGRFKRILLGLLPVALAAAPPLAVGAAETASNAAPKSEFRQFLEQDYLLGSWGGLRTDLHERGVDFEFLYAGSFPGNLHGGLERGTVYQGGLLMMLDLDSSKLAGYEGGRFHAGSLWLHGEKPFSDRYIGDLNKVNLLDYDNAFRLWELYYEQNLLGNKLSIRAGQMDINADFASPEYYNSLAGLSLLNQTFFFPTMAYNVFDQPFYPVGGHGLATTPNATPGVRVRFAATPECYIQAGVYDGNPERGGTGARVHLDSDEGALAYFEVGYRRNALPTDDGLPGNFKIGAWYHTDDFVDMYEGTYAAFDNFVAASGLPLPPVSPGAARWRDGNYGFYAIVDHMLYLEKDRSDPALQGLTGFARVAVAPPDRNLADLGIDGALVYKGLIPSRDWDTISLGASWLRISDDLRHAQRDINALFAAFGPVLPEADHETVLEASYRAQMTAWWTIQSSVQRVFHPGARVARDIPDAWALIFQTTVRF